jgi:hypothetical protein
MGEEMKRILCFMIAVVFFGGSIPVAMAGYEIELKNGRVLSTPKFWEENGIVKFYWESGIASIPKGVIRSVKSVEDAPTMKASTLKEATPEPKSTPSKDPIPHPKSTPPKEIKREVKIEEPGPAPAKEKIDAEYYKEQKALFTGKYEQAHERYLEASSRHDKEAKKEAWEEFIRYGGRVSALEEELKIKNQGVLPKWWNE